MKINYTESEPITIKVIFIDKEMEKAHNDYINRQRDCLNRIELILENEEIPAIYREWLESIYKFIKEEK